jgi:RNA-directed DNA polymerase
MDKAILRPWLQAGFLEKHVWHPSEAGTPQGGISSPVLANLTLDGLQRRLRECFPTTGKGSSRGKAACVNLIRFADDFIITGRTSALLEQEVRPVVEAFLRERGLELAPEKTRITPIEDGFDFLGQHFQKYQGKLLITPAPKSVRSLLERVRKIVKERRTAPAGHRIALLNPILRGWATYHRHICSKETFVTVDHAIFEALWRWARRRHPRKGGPWIKRKYFCTLRGNQWVFFGDLLGQAGPAGPARQRQRVTLYRLATTRIIRHVKVRSAANPYDPRWAEDYHERVGVQMTAQLGNRQEILRLWKRQNGVCPVCRQTITQMTGWDNHHVIWRVYGGGDEEQNRVLLHPTCHRQVHARWLEEAALRSERSVR